jgi:hydrogenase maturation protein HypF
VSYDGAGYGPDGTAWGGEILLADRSEYRRAFHLLPVPLPGGEAAIAHPGRMALSHLIAAFGVDEALAIAPRLLPGMPEAEARVIARQIERRVNCPMTSSMGRFFDAVAALLGATPEATYEGQPAMELEAMAGGGARGAGDTLLPYDHDIGDGIMDTRPIIRAIVEDLRRGVERELIAARFHETVAAFTVEACQRVQADNGPWHVALSGGVMQNALLVSRLLELLPAAGLSCHIHKEVPPNDGGMSLGQAVVASVVGRGAA